MDDPISFDSVYDYLEAIVYARSLIYSPDVTEDATRAIALMDWLADNGLSRYLPRVEADILLEEAESGEIRSYPILDKLNKSLKQSDVVGKYLTLEEAAYKAGLSYAHLRRLVSLVGDIPGRFGDRSGVGGSYRVLSRSSLDFVEWLKAKVKENKMQKGSC